MNRSWPTYGLFMVLFIALQNGFAQDFQLAENFDGKPFTEFVEKLESTQADYKFYFFEGWIKDVIVVQNGSANFKKVMDNTLEPVGLFWTITRNKQIVISKNAIPTYEQRWTGSIDKAEQVRAYSVTNEPQEDEWIILGDPKQPSLASSVNLAGTVISGKTRLPIDAAFVVIEELNKGAYTDSSGRFEFDIPIGRYRLVAQGLEQGQTKMNIQLFDDANIQVEVVQQEIFIDEIVVEAESNQNVRGVQMGVTPLKMNQIKELPTFLGETDIIKTLTLLPGVQSGGELSQGFNVRGSGYDQNLVLLNRMSIFNISHLFGFTAAFNPDVISGLELYKSSIPARFGGRIASVTDIQMRIPDKQKFKVQGGLSPLTGRLAVDIPLIKGKTSLLMSGRSSYADWLLSRINNPSLSNSRASYYDLNARIHHQGKKGTWDISSYLSNDEFSLNADTTFAYQNRNFLALYRLPFSSNKFGNFSIGYSQYDFQLSSSVQELQAFRLDYNISQLEAKLDINQTVDRHNISYGLQAIYFQSDPGTMLPLSANSTIREISLDNEYAGQLDAYISDEFSLSDDLEIAVGLRWSNYASFGPGLSNVYAENAPREIENVRETKTYGAGEVKQYYGGPEYRLSARYSLSQNTSLKMAINRNRQYLSLLINSTTISPTAFWQLANEHIKPQISDQFSLGIFSNLFGAKLEASVEVYYKYIRNLLDYKSGAQLILNEELETDLINAKGRGYGLEFLLKKRGKTLDGWISYTYSRSFVQASSIFPEESINQGVYFPSYFDQPHEAVFVANYNISRRFSISTNFTYSTGKPLTLPLAKYYFNNAFRLFYSARNEFRFPDYYRADISLNIKGNHRLDKKVDSSWSISIYNLTGRRNAYSIYFVTRGDSVRGYQLSIYGRPIATVTYNFKF